MMKRRWQLPARIAFAAATAGVVVLAQACGGGSTGGDATPTPTASTVAGETPVPRQPFDRGDGDVSEEFAAFLGISFEQLQSELSAEGATRASVAEAHGRTREELKTFLIEQARANFSEEVAAGTMSQEEADNLIGLVTSRIDDVIDGGAGDFPGIPPGTDAPGQAPPIEGANEEVAAFLGISLEQLESELGTDGATLASVAEAHGRTRDELKTFLIEQVRADFSDAVAAGTMSQEEADSLIEIVASRVGDIVDGELPSAGPGLAPIGR